MLFHLLNRRVGRMQVFQDDRDCDAFGQVVEQTLRVAPCKSVRTVEHLHREF
jgi:hypothetical protein